MNSQTDELRLYFARIKPMYNELFSMAYAICADYEQAEYALSSVILGGWNSRRHFRSTRGFRENMRSDLRRIALARVKPGTESTWEMRPAQDDDTPLRRALMQEEGAVQRAVMLRYGCGLSMRDMARVTGQTRRGVEQQLRRFLRRLKRRLGDVAPGKLEGLISDMCREELRAGGAHAPDMGAIFRTFEADAAQNYHPGTRLAVRVATCAAYVALILMIASIIWIVAAVARPARLEDGGLITETLSEQ